MNAINDSPRCLEHAVVTCPSLECHVATRCWNAVPTEWKVDGGVGKVWATSAGYTDGLWRRDDVQPQLVELLLQWIRRRDLSEWIPWEERVEYLYRPVPIMPLRRIEPEPETTCSRCGGDCGYSPFGVEHDQLIVYCETHDLYESSDHYIEREADRADLDEWREMIAAEYARGPGVDWGFVSVVLDWLDERGALECVIRGRCWPRSSGQ